MKRSRVLELAYNEAMRLWMKAEEQTKKYPDNEGIQLIEAQAWKEADDIGKLWKEAKASDSEM